MGDYCIYPDCNCPFDLTPDMKCLRGLPSKSSAETTGYMPTKFSKGETVRHVKTNGVYKILEVPDETKKLEHCNEPYYRYAGMVDDCVAWVRCKSEMEDGRFESM